MNGYAVFRCDAPNIGGGPWDLIGAEVFDQPVAVGVESVEAFEHQSEIELTVSGHFLIDMHDEAVGDLQILDVSQRGDRSHLVEDVVDPVAAVVDLLQALKWLTASMISRR